MSDVLWEWAPTGGPTAAAGVGPTPAGTPRTAAEGAEETPLPPVARRVLDAVRAGTAGALFPPVATASPDRRSLTVTRHLAGVDDARWLAGALSQPRFAPLLHLWELLDRWCRRAVAEHRDVLAPELFTVTNAALFGPVSAEFFVSCAAGQARYTRRLAGREADRCLRFLDIFLRRLRRDLGSGWPEEKRFAGPVVAVHAHGEETHNGRQRVLRLDLAGGGAVAYKPRPANGEVLFLAPGRPGRYGSVFDLLNRLPDTSGPVRLPLLRCWRGRGRDRQAYSWQEWIGPPAEWGVIRRSGQRRLHGARLPHRHAGDFWHRAGSLTAACFAFGITDLFEGNLLTGSRPEDPTPMLYPVDLEVYFFPVRRLSETGLVMDPVNGGHHHVGIERQARWCTIAGPLEYLRAGPGEGFRLCRADRSWTRRDARSVVTDTRGRVGYGAHLTAFLRGMFDVWTLLCTERARISRFVQRRCRDNLVRVLARPTVDYLDAVRHRRYSGGGADPRPGDPTIRYGTGELAQLRELDVPYFVRPAAGGPLRRLGPPSSRLRTLPAGTRLGPDRRPSPSAEVRAGAGLDLVGLGVAIRDAVEYVHPDLPATVLDDRERGVSVRLTDAQRGEASFDWPELGHRVTYVWTDEVVRLRLDPLPSPPVDDPDPDGPDWAGVRRQLLRIHRLDAALRSRLVSGPADPVDTRRLETLTDAAVDWLDEVVRAHGWPTRTRVGPTASEAASRLVQHARLPVTRHRAYLRLVRAAADRGEVPRRQVAYLTDALRVRQGRPQVFGTKFVNEGGVLMPYPIESPGSVDQRRREARLEPLSRYAHRLRRRFPLTGAEQP
ncbi:DUF6624 domain-containing protein [Micromonospora sagamiensis]|uniref:Uncharacterized protein DUF4135 n=1 Tax=Micromonospora sagamiensis TaxID=47875 RepID=A0A562WHI4_9ACTN|nr:DUF6624 domain-containing protein [Micromonospora sagamiensis]TWJ29608.1 uncharacterized protein DUF4135 [Micromonospora sagamiensis]BCL17363.1 hypothetical protein GCM10017556_51020 [Micromonospora sagamiensis]